MTRTITLNWIDWIVLAVVLVSILRGAKWGLLAGFGDLAVLVAAFLAAAASYSPVTAWGRTQLPGPPPKDWAAFITFVVIWIGLYILAGGMVRWALGGAAGAPAARLLGGVLGALRGLVFATAALVVVLAGPFDRAVATDASRSYVAPALLRANDRVQAALLPALPVQVPRIGPGGARF
jgi:uncharacterized membrane protein required for colicin V production